MHEGRFLRFTRKEVPPRLRRIACVQVLLFDGGGGETESLGEQRDAFPRACVGEAALALALAPRMAACVPLKLSTLKEKVPRRAPAIGLWLVQLGPRM